jgi:hypothetical protein
MKKLFGISVLVMMMVLPAWVVKAQDLSDFHKLSFPAKWKGEWHAPGVEGTFGTSTLEITRVDEKTVHVIHSYTYPLRGLISRVEDAEIISDNARPAFLWIENQHDKIVFRLEKDGTLTGESEDKKISTTMVRVK